MFGRKFVRCLLLTFPQFPKIPVVNVAPNCLLNGLIEKMRLENDAALARKLQLDGRTITMLRERTLSLSASMLMLIQHMTGMDGQELLRALSTAGQEQ